MKLVVLTGAGISAESGISTFRDSNGLWDNYRIEDVATPEAWEKNPELVQAFYNARRKQILAVEPNRAHQQLVELEKEFEVHIITQNIDDLHERAGSKQVTHLHGIITRSQSDVRPDLTYPITGDEIKMGDLCELGSQLRPHVVWFGEAVPMIETAAEICQQAHIFAVIGTSLAVYPAAGLIDFIPASVKKYIIDPFTPDVKRYQNIITIQENAVKGVGILKDLLLNER